MVFSFRVFKRFNFVEIERDRVIQYMCKNVVSGIFAPSKRCSPFNMSEIYATFSRF